MEEHMSETSRAGEADRAQGSAVGRPPTSVTRASQLIWLLVLVATAVTVLVVVIDDEVIAEWVGGQGRSPDDTRVPPSFTPVVIVLYVVVVSLLLVLLAFLRGGHNWARHCIAAGVGLVVLSVGAGLRTDPPAVFLAATLVILALSAVLLVLLYLPATNSFVGEVEDGSGTTHP
jgi:hypothetical protein